MTTVEKPVIDKAMFEKYAELKKQEKDVKKQIEDLSPKLRAQMEAASLDELESALGKYYFSFVPQWTFPEDIQKLEKELEAKKEVAKQMGTATHEDRKDFKFNAVKPPKADAQPE